MKQILVCFSILVVMMFPFSTVAQAEQANTIQPDYLQYDSFQKRYHDFMGELTYYMGVSYDSNDHYFRQNMQTFRNGLNSVYESRFLNNYLDSTEELFAKPVALLSSLPDLRKFLWDKIKGIFSTERNTVFPETTVSNTLHLPEGYALKVAGSEYLYRTSSIGSYGNGGSCPSLTVNFSNAVHLTSHNVNVIDKSICDVDISQNDFNVWRDSNDIDALDKLFQAFEIMRVSVNFSIVAIADNTVIDPYLPDQRISNVYNNVVNNYNPPPELLDYEPVVSPLLVCPSGDVPMVYDNGNYTPASTRSLLTVSVNSDGTAVYNGENCNIDFRFPSLNYDELNGVITADGISLVPNVPTLPPDDYDYSVLTYIRNSYDYATSVVSSGVNGLKSIVAGTAGLVTFTGSLFAFLPPEILTLFIGGFSIALGLWVFKK